MLLTTSAAPPALHRMTWAQTGWKPHDLQRAILLDPTRNQVAAWGRRAGKSQTGGHKLMPEVFRAWAELDDLSARSIRREYWIVGPEYSDAEKEFRVFWEALARLNFRLDHPGSYYNPENGEMVVSLFDRKFIVHAKSAKYPSTLVGEGLSGVIFSEAAKLKLSVWIKYIRPALTDFLGWSFFSSTPEGKNWFYDLYMAGQDALRPEWKSWRAPSWVNPYLYGNDVDISLLETVIEARRRGRLEELIPSLKFLTSIAGRGPEGIHPEIWQSFLDMSTESFNQEIAAMFTEFVGRVFKDFDEEFHVTDQQFNPDWATYACADYGFTNPTVWLLLQVSPDRRQIHVLAELYERGKDTEEIADIILARGLAPASCRMFYPDPAEPDRSRTLSRRLRLRSYDHGSIPKGDRIEWIRRGLKVPLHLQFDDPDRRPQLTIHRSCKDLIREMLDWKYGKTPEQAAERGRSAPEEPEDKDNHGPEALGRFYSGFFGSPHANSRTQQSKVKTRR